MGRRGKPYFQFQQFSIWQDRCAMKVGVDGILLGAWATVEATQQILDVGTGTGLIALMCAQRNLSAQITGIEIDPTACIQAQENITRSPWSDRIHIQPMALQDFPWPHSYDLVVSNPPFFEGSATSDTRAIARQQIHLSPSKLIQTVSPHLTPNGKLAMIVPFQQAAPLIEDAIAHHLFLQRRTNVRPTPTSSLKRSLLEFSCSEQPTLENEIILEESRHHYTEAYQSLIQDFFLKFRPNPAPAKH